MHCARVSVMQHSLCLGRGQPRLSCIQTTVGLAARMCADNGADPLCTPCETAALQVALFCMWASRMTGNSPFLIMFHSVR